MKSKPQRAQLHLHHKVTTKSNGGGVQMSAALQEDDHRECKARAGYCCHHSWGETLLGQNAIPNRQWPKMGVQFGAAVDSCLFNLFSLCLSGIFFVLETAHFTV